VTLAVLGAIASAWPAPAGAHTRTWYVRAGTTPRADGSRRHPFHRLARVERVSRPGDRIVVLAASARFAPLDGGIALKPRQVLLGAGPAVTGRARRSYPRIENTQPSRHHGDAVELANGATVRNLVIGPAYRGGIYGVNVARATVRGNDVSGTNSSCTTGFLVQPFTLPTLAPGGGVPFSSGLPNGWAGIMVDVSRRRSSLRFIHNRVHDAGCADGIDIRGSGTARVSAVVTRNVATRLQQGAHQQSVLAIGMQTIGRSRLTARLSRNAESYIGSATAGDEGNADSEGLFANAAGRSRLTARIDHNRFAHGLGHLSANCLEVVSSSGGPSLDVTLSRSSCDHVVGDIIEAVNLSRDARMRLAVDHVRAAHSEFVAGPGFHQVEPGDDGDCLFELGSGAHSTTVVSVRNSLLTDCVTDGLEVAGSVADGTGPVDRLSFDVRDSRITGNSLSNLRVATSSPISRLDGRIAHTDLSSSPGTPLILENVTTSGGTRARLDFGGGALGSPGGNCIFGGQSVDVEDARFSASARRDWWGRAGGPAPGRVVAAGGSVASGAPLATRPRGVC
jgi:hypothetical protein